MAASNRNAEINVSAGKGVQGGYCYRAPVGTPLPDAPTWTPTTEDSYVKTEDVEVDASKTYYTESGGEYTAVASPTESGLANYYELVEGAWTCMGFITEDGVNFATDIETSDFNDMNGDTMDTSQNTYGESFSCAFAETKASTFQSIYGEDAVTDENGVVTVHHKGEEPGYYSYAFLFLLKNGRKWVRYAEKCKRTEIDETGVSSSDVLAWSATYKAYKGDTTGDYFTDKFESTETEAA